jgi:hypothetical protein
VKKRLLLGLALFAGVGLAAAFAAWLLRPAPVVHQEKYGIDEEHYRMIRYGMTLQEVERLLGGPARYEATGSIEPAYSLDDDEGERERKELFLDRSAVYLDMPGYAEEEGVRVWVGDRGMVQVEIDKEGRVWNKTFLALRRTP